MGIFADSVDLGFEVEECGAEGARDGVWIVEQSGPVWPEDAQEDPGAQEGDSQALVFPQVYDSTKIQAQKVQVRNKYLVKGSAQGEATSKYNLGFNVVEGSVQVLLDGTPLVPNRDYTVDYIIGEVVIRESRALVPGANVQIRYEQNDLFQLASKTLLGARGDVVLGRNTAFGFTVMNLNQQSLSDKVRLGEEPNINTIIGIDGGTSVDLPFLTRALDALPLIQTRISQDVFDTVRLLRLFKYAKQVRVDVHPDARFRKSRQWDQANNDSMVDLLFDQLTSNRNMVWFMDGVTRTAMSWISPDAAANQQIVGADDFNADSQSDLLFWNNTTGALEFWLMNGATRMGAAVPISGAPTLALNWKLAATGDFNADSKPDLLWRNTTSQKLVIWTMNGTAKTGNVVPTPSQAVDPNWEVVAALDYNHDGNRDLLWYNYSSGKIVLWTMDASVVRTTGQFTNPANAGDANWRVFAGGDYGTGGCGPACTHDIVWRNATSGKEVVWYMGFFGSRTSGTFTTPDAPTTDPDGNPTAAHGLDRGRTAVAA